MFHRYNFTLLAEGINCVKKHTNVFNARIKSKCKRKFVTILGLVYDSKSKLV